MIAPILGVWVWGVFLGVALALAYIVAMTIAVAVWTGKEGESDERRA